MGIGARIKNSRKKMGYTQIKLASEANISRSYLADLEHERYNPSIATLEKIAEALNISADRLTGESASVIIEEALLEKKVTIEEVAERAGVSLHWLQNVDTFIPGEWGGENDIAYKWITNVAKVLGISGSRLRAALARQEIPTYDGPSSTPIEDYADEDFDEADSTDMPDNVFTPKMKKVPLLGTIAAGEPVYADEEYGTYVELNLDIKADFALKIKGDSMIDARINDGDIVFIRKQPLVDNGEVAAISVDDEVTLKRFYRNNGGVILKPENSKYQPKYYTEEDFKNIRILGKAILFQSEVR